jgi:UDP-2,3-diacylglucosamine hydrolase
MQAPPPSCARAVFFSDVHLDPAAPEKTARFLAFLAGLGRLAAERAYVLGDLFHYWVGPGHERLGDFRAPIEALRRLSEAGCKIVIVHGNRDFHVGEELSRAAGADVVRDAALVRVAGRTVYVAHGDLLCARDTRYRAMRRVIRSRVMRRAYLALPLAARIRVAGGMRGMSEREVAAKSVRTLALAPSAVRRVFRGSVDAAVVGHVHRARRIALAVGGRRRFLFSLGAWDGENVSYLVADERGYRLFDGRGAERVLEENHGA